jgi:hypothetical protein
MPSNQRNQIGFDKILTQSTRFVFNRTKMLCNQIGFDKVLTESTRFIFHRTKSKIYIRFGFRCIQI